MNDLDVAPLRHGPLKHDPEKCIPVFRKDHAQTKGFRRVDFERIGALSVFDGFLPRRLLKLCMPLRVDQAIDPLRCGDRKPHRHQFSCRRRQPVLWRRAMHMRAIGVGNDQAGVSREDLARQILGEGEEQPVAMGAVFRPFLVGPQILQR
jgi:hypothetical protein